MGENNLKKRIRNAQCREKIMSAEEAASFIRPGYDHRFQRFHPGRISKDDPGSPCQTGRGGRKTGSDPSHRRIHRR